MTDQEIIDSTSPSEAAQRRRVRPMLLVGSVLWVVCLIVLVAGWVQWKQNTLKTNTQVNVGEADEGDGRSTKQFKLVPQKDGSLVAKEVTEEEIDNPWGKEGIEDFSFTDTDGRTITKKDLLGKPFIISFIFTMCQGPCPLVTKQMREIQDLLKDYDFNLVSLTVDPERDTVDTLQNYGKNSGANFHRWRFLSGDKAEIYGLIQRSFLMPVEDVTANKPPPGNEFIHSTNIMLVDANGKVVGKYNALKEAEMVKLRREIKQLAKPQSSRTRSTNDEGETKQLPSWAAALPTVNATLNGLAGIMLAVGFVLIKNKQRSAHAWTMIAAFLTSILFLACYLIYHFALHAYTGEPGRRFGHSGTLVGTAYLAILLTHVVLAAVVPVLASITLYRAWRQDWPRHRRIASITFPIWVYVSVTGVIIYVMLYHWPGSAS